MTSATSRLLANLVGAAVVACLAGRADAGGPLLLVNGKPVLWASRDVRGGPLNSQTVGVDAQGARTVYYRVDTGSLGPLPNADALRLVDRIFGEYSAITSGIRYANAGPILDPATGMPVDVTGTNVGKFLSEARPTFQNPIIFDSDGSITGKGGVLGFFGYLAFESDNSALTEGFVVLNGASLSPPNAVSTPSFLGVFTHEFGHFAGPLDHAQANGDIAVGSPAAVQPAGFTTGQAYDLFAPFTETLYPFVFGPQRGAAQSMDSGYFIATIDLDTRNALSNLYPTDAYRGTTGSIEGKVFFESGGDDFDVNGVNVVARRITESPYPPPAGTQAFPTPPTFDADGIPGTPPAQAATDPLATFSSAVTGLEFGPGMYRVQGLPPGSYLVALQRIDRDATGGSGIGPLTSQLALPVKEEYFSGSSTSSVVTSFVPVAVQPGLVTRGVDLRINGLDTRRPRHLTEAGAHFTVSTAQDLGALPVRVEGEAAATDPSQLAITVQPGVTVNLHDLYKLTLNTPSLAWISLEPRSGSGDLDLYLFPPPDPGSNVIPLSGVPAYSATETSHEMIGIELAAGTWYIGVDAYAGDVTYELRVLGVAKGPLVSLPFTPRPRVPAR